MNLSTTYLGLNLRTPLVVAASPLSLENDNLKRMEDAGAAAVVFHSLFEEQTDPGGGSACGFRGSPDAYLDQIAAAKRSVTIPVIGSLNCTTIDGWISYARRIKEAGADALELNIYKIPTRLELTGATVEEEYLTIVRTLRAATKLPLAVKLSPFFSNFANMAARLDALGPDGLVLFNRFYQPDIDLEKMAATPSLMLSTQAEMRLPLRWIGILYGKLRASLAATTGIHRASDVIRMVMVGADVTMLCSVLLRHGIEHLRVLENEIAEWLEQHHYGALSEIKGIMSQQNCSDPSAFERAQYVHALSTYTPLFVMRGLAGAG
jgi:dihydroorotate dehydrogenase (fumarate)